MKVKYITTLVILFSTMIPAFAQGGPPATPIDGGLSLLLAGGAMYGLKKIRQIKKQ